MGQNFGKSLSQLLALTSQVLGWLLITTSLPRLPAATTSLLLMIQPVGALALGALIFSERPSGLQLGGVVLVMGAVVFATRRPTSPAPAATTLSLSEIGPGRVPEPAAPRPVHPRR